MRNAVLKTLVAFTAIGALVSARSLVSAAPPVSTAYMIQKLANLLPNSVPNTVRPDPYWDVLKAGPTLWNDIAYMQDNGWLETSSTSGSYTFGADRPISPREAAILVTRMFSLPERGANAYDFLDKIGAFHGVQQTSGGFTPGGATQFIHNIAVFAQQRNWRIALSATGKADLKNPALATQAGMAAGLLKTFSHLSVWPKILSMNAPFSARSWIPPSARAWVGLRSVFPGQPSSRYAALLGLSTPQPDGPVTAGQAALWIARWAEIARKINLQTSVSRNPYEWAKTFSLFYGTNVQSPATVLTAADVQRILANLVDSARGFRILSANRVSFLAPLVTFGKPGVVPNSLYSTAVAVLRQLEAHTGRTYTWSDWPKLYSEAVAIQDSTQVTLTPSGALYARRTNANFGAGSSFQWISSNGMITGEWNQSMTAINSGNPHALFGLHYPVTIHSNTFYDGASAEKGAQPQIPGAQMLVYTSDPFSRTTGRYFGVLLHGPSYRVLYKGDTILKVMYGPSFISKSISLYTDYPAWAANQLG